MKHSLAARMLGAAVALAARTAEAAEPVRPLDYGAQARETRIDAALTQSRHNDTLGKSSNGFQVGLMFGAFPQLKWARIGGDSGVIFRAIDNKTFLLSLPYAELTGGIRAAFLEAYAFIGMSWLTAGIAHGEFAFGALAPRAGVAFGTQLRGVALHAFAATEYHPFVVNSTDIRATMFGLSFSLISRP